jgi:peptidoglycan/LPS O-acetylase OafA/YrhL
MDFKTLHKQRKFISIAALLGAIGMLLPWIDLGGFGSINGMHGYPTLMFFAFAGAAVMCYLGDQKEYMAKNNWLIALGCAALCVLINIFYLIGISFEFGFTSFGYWLVLIATIALAYFTFTMKNPKDDLKQSLTDMKKQVENKLDNDPNT